MAFVSRAEAFLENRFKEWRTGLEEWKKIDFKEYKFLELLRFSITRPST